MAAPTIPDKAPVQFLPMAGNFYVDKMTDPNGAPSSVLEAALGFEVKGHIELPGWLTGKGTVRLFADEFGGPLDEEIGNTMIDISGGSTPLTSYAWTISVPGGRLPDQPAGSGLYHLGLAFTFVNPTGVRTDIVSFFDVGVFMIC